MNTVEMFASYRFVFSCLMAIGGIACVWFGYRLFVDGSGLYKSVDKLAIKHNEFAVSVTGMSAGGFLMLASAAWAYFAYASVPRLEMAGDTTKIVSAPPPASPVIANPGKPPVDFATVLGLPVADPTGKKVGTISGVAFDAGDNKWKAVIKGWGEATPQSPPVDQAVDLLRLKVDSGKVIVEPAKSSAPIDYQFMPAKIPPAK